MVEGRHPLREIVIIREFHLPEALPPPRFDYSEPYVPYLKRRARHETSGPMPAAAPAAAAPATPAAVEGRAAPRTPFV